MLLIKKKKKRDKIVSLAKSKLKFRHIKGQNDIFGSTYSPTPENVRCNEILFLL